MSRETEKRLLDVGMWFEEHRRNCTDPEKRMEFCMRGIEHILWLLSYYTEDIQELENRKRANGGVLMPGMYNFNSIISEWRERESIYDHL